MGRQETGPAGVDHLSYTSHCKGEQSLGGVVVLGRDDFMKTGDTTVCLCFEGMPLQRACCLQERRDSWFCDALKLAAGGGIWYLRCVCHK